MVAAACCDRAWAGSLSTSARRVFLTLALTSVVLWVTLVVAGGTYLASAVSYYRGVSIVLMVLGMATAVTGWEAARKRDPTTLVTLTPTELQIARLVSSGLSNKDVAAQCWVSPRTVAFHLRNVFAKAGVTSRGELAQLDLG